MMGYSYSNMLVELQAINYAFKKNSISIFTDNYITADHFSTYREHFEWLMGFVKEYGQLPSKETFAVHFKDSDTKFEWIEVNESEQYIVDMLRGALPIPIDYKELNLIGKTLNIPKEEVLDIWEKRVKQVLESAGMNIYSNSELINSMFNCAKKYLVKEK